MNRFLAIETATDLCSVALLAGDCVLVERVLSRPRAHSENLTLMIRDVLSYAGVAVESLSGIVVSKGPGSYTGLRIGVSAAKGLAFSHDIPLIGIPSLTGLATAALPFAKPGDGIAAAFNSRRNEVYLGLYTVNNSGKLEDAGAIASLQREEITAHVHAAAAGPNLVVAGEGGTLVAEALSDQPAFSIDLIPPEIVCPSASVIAVLGAERHERGLLDDLADFEPHYLNEFIPKKRKKSIFDRLPF